MMRKVLIVEDDEAMSVALRDGFNPPFAVAVINHQKADRHIGGNDLPGRARVRQLLL